MQRKAGDLEVDQGAGTARLGGTQGRRRKMTDAEFRATLAAIYADQRRKAETEAAIERQLAAAWFLHHPEEAAMPRRG